MIGDRDAMALTELIAKKGNMRTVSIAVGIPYETLRDWCYGRRKPASYVLSSVRVKIAALPNARGTAAPTPARDRIRWDGYKPAAARQRL